MKKGFWLIFFAMVMALIVGCAGFMSMGESVCATVPEGEASVICEVAGILNLPPETVAGVLVIGNLTALMTDTYTPAQAMAFIDDVYQFFKDAEKGGLTYAAGIRAAERKYNQLSPKIRAVFSLSQEFIQVPEVQADKPLAAFDYKMIYAALEDQRKIVRPFLIE